MSQVASWIERAGNMGHALRHRSEHDARMRWTSDHLAAFQRARLGEIVRHATAHSAFYRELYGGRIDRDVELAELPIVTKAAMMASFDRFVTDPRLRRDTLLEHLETLHGDELFLGEFRVMTSSGSSGQKAIYVYDRAAWRAGILPGSLRMSRMIGLRPSLPRPRLAMVGAGDGKHMTYRGSASMNVGLMRTQRFPATLPVAELAAGLDTYRPDFLLGYPSVLALLAEEQRLGRLDIRPKAVVTSSELRTEPMTEHIRRAWGVEPFNCLGLTETGIIAIDCAEHAGLHVFEDLGIIEVVDAENRPVSNGVPGAKALVTNLWNRVQPIVRFEVSDLMTLSQAPCACGSTLQRITALDGRSDDMLELPGLAGSVVLHPMHLRSALAGDRAVLQYQVVHERAHLDVCVVLAADAPTTTVGSLQRRLEAALRKHGARVDLTVRAVDAIPRESGPGKLKLVRSVRS